MRSQGADPQKIDKSFNQINNNFQEEIYSINERKSVNLIEKLLTGDINFLDSEDSLFRFLTFLCMQYFRTKKIRDNFLNTFPTQLLKRVPEFNNIDINRIQPVLSHIFANNVASHLFVVEEYKVSIFENKSKIPFITGDQPVINTHATGNEGQDISDLELYYPLSPERSVLISKSDLHRDQVVKIEDEAKVSFWNQHIASQALEQLYAKTDKCLETYQDTTI